MTEDCANVLCLVTTVPVDGSVCFQRVCSGPIEWDAPEECVALATCLLSDADAYGLIISDDVGVRLSNVKMSVCYKKFGLCA